jgi:2-C-methyl-D-erythritol 4-phosphate cytidylyltransferase
MTLPSYWLLMPAAGSGSRFGGATPKQHLPLADATVLELSLAPFLADPHCRGVVLALSVNDSRRAALASALPPAVRIVTGGAERVDSVLAALDALGGEATDADWVLVHDAVRPCLAPADRSRLLQAGCDSADGALLAAPLADTLKRDDSGGHVAVTVPRAGLWRALTPQMFRHGALRTALRAARAAGRVPTDEAEAIEWQGGRPLLVAAAHSNIKITTADDLPLAAAILATRGEPR